MKSIFSGFYSINDENIKKIWTSEKTLFVFDTNCLLNLYRCEDHTRDDILSVMSEISKRTWIPFQVGFEYQRNRRNVIEESIKSLNDIKKELTNIYDRNILSSCGIKKHLYNSLSKEITDLQGKLQITIDEYINSRISSRITSKEKISEHDSIRSKIDSIILENVGSVPTQETINKINEEGLIRYEKKQPPGYMDNSKKEMSYFSNVEFQDKYGDLYLWKEIIGKAKEDSVRNVIFICDDNKKDWWFIQSGKTHGVLESLKTEICKESNIENFKIINQLTFLHEAESYLDNIKIRESSLKEVEELSQAVINENNISGELINETINNIHFSNIKTDPSTYLEDKGNYNLKLYSKYFKSSELFSIGLLKSSSYNIGVAKNLGNRISFILSEIEVKDEILQEIMGSEIYNSTVYPLSKQLFQLGKLSTRIGEMLKEELFINDDVLHKLNKLNKELSTLIDNIEFSIEVIESYINRIK